MSITGLKFIYKNDTHADFLQTNETSSNYTVNLVNTLIIGLEITSGPGIQSLKFELHDMLTSTNYSTFEIGKPSGCYSYLNSKVMHTNYFRIDTLYGCIDNKTNSYLPSLSLEYSFSNCFFTSAPTTTAKMTSTPTTTKTTASTSTTKTTTTSAPKTTAKMTSTSTTTKTTASASTTKTTTTSAPTTTAKMTSTSTTTTIICSDDNSM